ncbi:hypothetical protein AM500_21445 [Bacillus sp. FJAT-18017]|uniref:hypothetical protein n=1 Tax=Bacillus sp. FJAT-18017 TaxID=1705566 RepID=UPI0006AF5691|nr:hypothetical protein [Bacillus sp. FJAT-18017]ALC92071.1 hypothetical protein AM500_21445 [Bacillus sp. FJAT-18017]
MENIKKILPNLDIVIILTIVGYSLVYSYNLGVYVFWGIPTHLIELGVNNITDTLISLSLLLLVYVPTMSSFIFNPQKRKIIVFIIVYAIALMILYYKEMLFFEFSSTLIVVIGICIIFLLKKKMNKTTILIVISIYAIISSLFMGYMQSYGKAGGSAPYSLLLQEGKRYVILASYKDNYIVTQLKNKNEISLEYKLIAFDDSKSTVKREELKLNIKK